MTTTVCLLLLDLETSIGESYRRNIIYLREQVKLRKHGDIYVLRPQEVDPVNFFNVVLYTDKGEATFRFRADDLYLLGYCIGPPLENQNRDVQPKSDLRTWHEVTNPEGKHLIHKSSSFIKFGADYDSLQKHSDVKSITALRLQRDSVKSDLNKFLQSPKDMCKVGSILLDVVLLISESMRFHELCEHISKNFLKECVVTEYMYSLIHKWDQLGQDIVMVDNSSSSPPSIIEVGKEKKKVTMQEARAILAMMKFPKKYVLSPVV